MRHDVESGWGSPPQLLFNSPQLTAVKRRFAHAGADC
jgi:hypothetical protein